MTRSMDLRRGVHPTMDVKEHVKVLTGGDNDFGIQGYTMMKPPPYDKIQQNKFGGEKNRDYMSLVIQRGSRNPLGPGSYKPHTESTIETDPKRVHFYNSIEKNAKKLGVFGQAAMAKAYIPGVGTYKALDVYKERPKLIFKCDEKRKGPID